MSNSILSLLYILLSLLYILSVVNLTTLTLINTMYMQLGDKSVVQHLDHRSQN